MADYKIRILRIYRSCCLKNKMIIAVKICLYFAVAVVYSVDYCFYCICMIIRNLNRIRLTLAMVITPSALISRPERASGRA